MFEASIRLSCAESRVEKYPNWIGEGVVAGCSSVAAGCRCGEELNTTFARRFWMGLNTKVTTCDYARKAATSLQTLI